MKIILAILFLFYTTICSANTIWYDSTLNKRVIDTSNGKTKQDIINEFNFSDQVQPFRLRECESYIIENNQFTIYDYCKERKDAKKVKNDAKKVKEDSIKLKLNLSNQEWKDLKEALGL